jgi:hypothetical protein
MPIEGYYKTGLMLLPAPYVQALVFLPRLNVSAAVELLIDTGADNTCLHLAPKPNFYPITSLILLAKAT